MSIKVCRLSVAGCVGLPARIFDFMSFYKKGEIMKTILDYMNQISALIESKRPGDGGPWQVFVLDKRIRIGQVALTVRRDCALMALTKRDINEGLKTWQWNMIHKKLTELIREGGLK